MENVSILDLIKCCDLPHLDSLLMNSTGACSFSVNGRDVKMMTESCDLTEKRRNSLSDTEHELIDHVKAKLESIEDGDEITSGKGGNCLSRYELTQGGAVTTNCRIKESLTSSNGFSVSKQNDKHYSVTKHGLPDKLARLFVIGDVIGFVYLNGEVIMKPVNCLKIKERRLVKSLDREVHRVAENVVQNIEKTMAAEIGSITGQFPTKTRLTGPNLDGEMQDLTKSLNNEFGDILSGF